jgi:hypothetical protein
MGRKQIPGMLNKPRIILLVLSLPALFFSTGCTGQKTESGTIRGRIDLKQLLSWLPADTETLLVANGPFWMSSFQLGEEASKDREATNEEVEKHFEGLTLQLFNFGKGLLQKQLGGRKILFALEASRHFRPPAGLGELPFEGCALAIFQDDLSDRRDAFMKSAAQAGVRIEEIEGQEVVVIEEPMEEDTWTIFVTFPQKGVVLVATNERFLEEMLARMRGAEGARALPDSLPEWKYVDEQGQFWGLRHFDKRQASEDPTSPFGGQKSANIPDEEAVGLTYQCNLSKERKATLTYLSGPRAELRKIEERRFPISAERKETAGLHIQYQELGSGVMRTTYDLSSMQPLDWFFFVFMANMGHGTYI